MRLKNLKKFTSPRRCLATVLLIALTLNQAVPVHASLFPAEFTPVSSFLNNIQIPEALGRVEEVYQGKTDELVVYIQDAHANYSAQQSIASLIDMFVRNHDFSVVGQEAAEGRIDTALLRAFPAAKTRREVMDRYLHRGDVGGAEYLAVAGDRAFDFVGVDKRKLYLKNLSEFFALLDAQKNGFTLVKAVRTAMKNLEDTVYSKRHREFRELLMKHQNQQVDFKVFLDELKKYAEASDEDLSQYSQLSKLFASDHPSLQDIDVLRLPYEIDELTFSLRARLAETPLEKELISLDEYLSLLKAGFKIELSRKDFLRLCELHSFFPAGRITGLLTETSERFRLAPVRIQHLTEMEELFAKILDFYKTAGERDEVFVKQIRKEMHLRNKLNSILVTGGFHKDGITKKLRNKEISYMVITPHMAEPDSRDHYIRLMEKNRSLIKLPERNTLGLPSPLGTPEYRLRFQTQVLVEMGVDSPSLLQQQGIYLFGDAAFSSGDLLSGAKRWNNRTQAGEKVDLVDAVRSTATRLPEKGFGFGAKAAGGQPGKRIDLGAELVTKQPAKTSVAAAPAKPAPPTKREIMAEPSKWKKVVETISFGFFKPATNHKKDMLATFAALDNQREGGRPPGIISSVSPVANTGSTDQDAKDDYTDARAEAISELAALLKEGTMQVGGATKTVEPDVRWSMLHEDWFFVGIHRLLAEAGREKIFDMLDVQPDDLVYVIEYSNRFAISAKIVHVSDLNNPKAEPILSHRPQETVPEGGVIQVRKYLILPKTEEVKSLAKLTKLFPALADLARIGPDIVSSFTPKATSRKVDPKPQAGFGSDRSYLAEKVLLAAGAVAIAYLTVQEFLRAQLFHSYDRVIAELFKVSQEVRKQLGLEAGWTERMLKNPIGSIHQMPATIPGAGLEERYKSLSEIARVHARFVVRMLSAKERLQHGSFLNVAKLWHNIRALSLNRANLQARYSELLDRFGITPEPLASGFGVVERDPNEPSKGSAAWTKWYKEKEAVKHKKKLTDEKKKKDVAEKAKKEIRKELQKTKPKQKFTAKDWLYTLLTLGIYGIYKAYKNSAEFNRRVDQRYEELKLKAETKAASKRMGDTSSHRESIPPAHHQLEVPSPVQQLAASPTKSSQEKSPSPDPKSGEKRTAYLDAKARYAATLLRLMREGILEAQPGTPTKIEDLNERWEWLYKHSLYIKWPGSAENAAVKPLEIKGLDLLLTIQRKGDEIVFESLKTVGGKGVQSQPIALGGEEQKGQVEGLETRFYLVLPSTSEVSDHRALFKLFPELEKLVRKAEQLFPASHPTEAFKNSRQASLGLAGFGAKAGRPMIGEQETEDISDLWLFINDQLEFAGRINGKPRSWVNFLVKTWMAPGLRAQRTREGKGVLIDEKIDRLNQTQISGASIKISGTTSAGRPVEQTWTVSDQKPLTNKEWLNAIRPLNLNTIERIDIHLPSGGPNQSGFGAIDTNVIFFDFGGVLAAERGANFAETVGLELLKQAGIDRKGIEDRDFDDFKDLVVLPKPERTILHTQPDKFLPWLERINSWLMRRAAARQISIDEFKDIFFAGRPVNPHIVAKLPDLKKIKEAMGIRFGVIVNFEAAGEEHLKRFIAEKFAGLIDQDLIVISGTVGQTKEAGPQMFEAALQKFKDSAKEEPRSPIFIDNDEASFVHAQTAGIAHNIHYALETGKAPFTGAHLFEATLHGREDIKEPVFGSLLTKAEQKILAIDAQIDRLRAAITEAEQGAERLHSNIRRETLALNGAKLESKRREIAAMLLSLNNRVLIVNSYVESARRTNGAEIDRLSAERRRLKGSAAGFGTANASKINLEGRTAQRQVVSAVKEVVRNAALEAAAPISGFKTIVFSSEKDLARFEKAVLKYSPAVRAQVLGTFNDIAAGWDMADDQKNKIWLRLSELFSSRGQRIYVGANDNRVYSGIRGGVEAVLLGQKTEYLLQKVQDQFILEMMSQNGDRFIDVVLEALYLKQLAENLTSVAA